MSVKRISLGRQFEEAVLGVRGDSEICRPPKRRREFKNQRRRRPLRPRPTISYLPFEEALQEAMVNGRVIGQPKSWPPPGSPARRLYWCVLRRFPLAQRSLRLIATVGTALDLYHGVDLLFWHQGRIVTIDLSRRPAKTLRADFLLTPADFADRCRFNQLTRQIARRLRQGIRKIEKRDKGS